MKRSEAQTGMAEAAGPYRTLARVLLLLAVVLGLTGVLALRRTLPRELAASGFYLGAASALAAGWSGWRGHQVALRARERASHQGMVIAIAAQLARQDDATLRGIIGRGGPAAEAAEMVLAGRIGAKVKVS